MSRPRDTAAHVAPSRDSSIGYRPALDGIRAVAVLAVIAYHLGYGRIRGGFLASTSSSSCRATSSPACC